jgi:Pyruvate/2-oxoacid:ferredoxin oxidoreductase delta subunit
MSIRKIVHIDEDKCTGCGLCIPKCAEGALQIINGKAKLVSDVYCDGLGACLGECPEGAITLIEREANEFDEAVTAKHLKEIGHQQAEEKKAPAGKPKHKCPSSKAKTFSKKEPAKNVERPSALTHWPIKIELAAPSATFFKDADILITADCAPFAYANFHNDFMKKKTVIIGCPKLNDSELYYNKIVAILKNNNIKSLTVAHMEVPCCFGLNQLVDEAIRASGKDIRKKEVVIGIEGNIIKR